jgi:hypothetical protein
MSAPRACPPWCEKPVDHTWGDVWLDGPIRIHTWTRPITTLSTGRDDEIRIEESEQHTDAGVIRRRLVALDVEAPTEWDLSTAQRACDLLTEAIAVAGRDWPTDEVSR